MMISEVWAVDREEWPGGSQRLRLGMLSVTSRLRITLAQQFIKSPFVAEATGDGDRGLTLT